QPPREEEAARAALARRPRPLPGGRRGAAAGDRCGDRRAKAGRRARRGRGRGARPDRALPRRRWRDVVAGIWVYAEVRPDGVDPSALELLTKARTLGADVAAVALGPGAAEAARVLGEYGAGTVYAGDDVVYAEYPGEAAA